MPILNAGPESRYHWPHECSQSRPGCLYMYVAISHVLAGCGPTLWFDPSQIWNASPAHPTHDKEWWRDHNVELGKSGMEISTPHHQDAKSTVTADRCLAL